MLIILKNTLRGFIFVIDDLISYPTYLLILPFLNITILNYIYDNFSNNIILTSLSVVLLILLIAKQTIPKIIRGNLNNNFIHNFKLNKFITAEIEDYKIGDLNISISFRNPENNTINYFKTRKYNINPKNHLISKGDKAEIYMDNLSNQISLIKVNNVYIFSDYRPNYFELTKNLIFTAPATLAMGIIVIQDRENLIYLSLLAFFSFVYPLITFQIKKHIYIDEINLAKTNSVNKLNQLQELQEKTH